MGAPQALSLTAIGSGAVAGATFAASAMAPMNLGSQVLRADGNIAQNPTVLSLFTVTGVCEIRRFFGQVGTIIQAQANAAKIQHKATGQTAVDLCATLDINALAAGKFFTVTGVLATAATGGFGVIAQTTPWIVQAGTIDMNCAAASSGTMRWELWYVPLTVGSTIVAA